MSKRQEHEGPACELEAPSRCSLSTSSPSNLTCLQTQIPSSLTPYHPPHQPDPSKVLPIEILCEIFTEACDPSTTVTVPNGSGDSDYVLPAAAVMMHVNQRWRKVAMNHKALWSDIKSTLKGLWILHYIQRSGTHPLKIEIWTWTVGGFDETVKAIAGAVSHTTHLKVVSNFYHKPGLEPAPDVKESRETQLLSALCERTSDTLKRLQLTSIAGLHEPRTPPAPPLHPKCHFVVPNEFLSGGAPNLKCVVVGAPFYLSPRHSILLNRSEYTLALFDLDIEAFMSLLHHPPAVSEVWTLISSLERQPYVQDDQVEAGTDKLDQTPASTKIKELAVHGLTLGDLRRLTRSPFFASSTFEKLWLQTSLTVGPVWDEGDVHSCGLLVQRMASVKTFEYITIDLAQAYLRKSVTIECGPLSSILDQGCEAEDDNATYRIPIPGELPFGFAFQWEVSVQWPRLTWKRMWPAEIPTPRHLRFRRAMLHHAAYDSGSLQYDITTVWLQVSARFSDVTTLSLDDPRIDALALLEQPTDSGDPHSLPFPRLDTLILTGWTPIIPYSKHAFTDEDYVQVVGRTLGKRHQAGLPHLRRLVLAELAIQQDLLDRTVCSYAKKVVWTQRPA